MDNYRKIQKKITKKNHRRLFTRLTKKITERIFTLDDIFEHADQCSKEELLQLIELHEEQEMALRDQELLILHSITKEIKNKLRLINATSKKNRKLVTQDQKLQFIEQINQIPNEDWQNILTAKVQELNQQTSEDYYKLKIWIQRALQIPHTSNILPSASSAVPIRSLLDEQIFGMDFVKEKLLRHLFFKQLNTNTQEILCLNGPPGIGKTEIVQSFARIVGYPFFQLNVANIKNPEYLIGFEDTYVGSKNGQIVEALIQTKTNNCIIYLDEVDKCPFEVQNIFLHILDKTQNKFFQDQYFSPLKIDLSNVWFIMSSNDSSNLSQILTNRIDIIHLQDYTDKQKKHILTNFVIPKTLSQYNLTQTAQNAQQQQVSFNIPRNLFSADAMIPLKSTEVTMDLSLVDSIIIRNHGSTGIRQHQRDISNLIQYTIFTVAQDLEVCEYRISPKDLQAAAPQNNAHPNLAHIYM